MRENVIVYCRVSSDEQTLGSSLQVQEERICRYCEAKDYNVIKVYKEDESAKTFEKRPEMMRIVDYRVLLEAPVETKIKMLGSMFPEKIEFDGTKYRTASYNKVLNLIYQNAKILQRQEKEKSGLSEENPDSVPRAVLTSIPLDAATFFHITCK